MSCTQQGKRACAYIRVSDPRQVKLKKSDKEEPVLNEINDRFKYEGSLEEQERDIRAYCEANNICLVRIYVDAGISGRKIERKAFHEMVADVKTGAYDLVIMWKVDRISRRPSMGYRLRDAMDMTGTEFYSIIEGDRVNNRMMFGFLLIVAEQESEDKSVRARMGHRSRMRNGKVSNIITYGYKPGEDGKPEIVEEEAEVVRRVFDEYLKGTSSNAILDMLEAEGIQKRSKTEWRPKDVRRILKATEYVGKGWAGRYRYEMMGGKPRVIENDPSEWTPIEYPHIVSEDVFQAAQEIMRRNRNTHQAKGYQVEFPLRHLVRCATCGNRFMPQVVTSERVKHLPDGTVERKPRGTIGRSYACAVGRYKKNGNNCAVKFIGAEKLEAKVWEKVKADMQHPERIKDFIDAQRREYEETGSHAEIDRLRKLLDGIEEERQRALTVFQKGYLGEAELDVRMKGISERREMYEQDLAKMEAAIVNYDKQMEALEMFKQYAESVEDLESISRQRRDDIIKAWVVGATIGRDEDGEVIVVVDALYGPASIHGDSSVSTTAA